MESKTKNTTELQTNDNGMSEPGGGKEQNRVPVFAAMAMLLVVTVASSFSLGYRMGHKAVSAGDSGGVVVNEEIVLPPDGAIIPVLWGDIGQRLTETGVIDRERFMKLYQNRGGLDSDELELLDGKGKESLTITRRNAGFILNVLWAFGLSNKNEILEQGPMQDERYGGAGGFASTGGWSLAVGSAMDHFSRYSFVTLTSEQQERVINVSKGIYRPCCGNATYFPDCNHGMAMLGLLELMAAQDMSEDEMYQYALQVNSYWFPQTYLTIAKYFAEQGVAWNDVDAKEVLGYDYSSGAGYQNILSKVEPAKAQGGGSCGV